MSRVKARFLGEESAMVVDCDTVSVASSGALWLNRENDAFKVVIAPGQWAYAFDVDEFDDMADDQ